MKACMLLSPFCRAGAARVMAVAVRFSTPECGFSPENAQGDCHLAAIPLCLSVNYAAGAGVALFFFAARTHMTTPSTVSRKHTPAAV